MCHFPPLISKAFFLFINYSQRHLLFGFKNFIKKRNGGLSTVFLKSISLNYSHERLVYIFCTYLRILSGQATSFVSFFGGRKAFNICFWRKGKQRVKSFAL